MKSLSDTATREEVLTFIAQSASYGNLGLFVGAGFCMAVLNETDDDEIALSWNQLLKKVAKKMHVDYPSVAKPGVSYPEMASAICAASCRNTEDTFEEALQRLKSLIAVSTGWYPTPDQRSKYSEHLESFNPAWIITTNYDLVIEALLTGRSIPLGPNDSLSAPEGFIPVFHLHGVRTKPEEIIIAQEDYITLFRPGEYRQLKLALTIKESTTLFLGYGLGDVNVLTALDWSRNVFRGKTGDYPSDTVQVFYTTKPRRKPYRDKHGIMILETADLSDFFEEYGEARNEQKKTEDKHRTTIKNLAKKLGAAADEFVEQFIDDQSYRKGVLRIVAENSDFLVANFISFFTTCVQETWRRSQPRGAFGGYNQNLTMIMDTLTNFDFEKFPPALFQTIAESLEKVAPLIGSTSGQSYAAHTTWETRKEELEPEIVKELTTVAKQYGYGQTRALLKTIRK